jgi:hypothetical protein
MNGGHRNKIPEQANMQFEYVFLSLSLCEENTDLCKSIIGKNRKKEKTYFIIFHFLYIRVEMHNSAKKTLLFLGKERK